MGPTRQDDDLEETQRTIAAFGGTEMDRTRPEEHGADSSDEGLSPMPLSTPSDEQGTELPSVIEPGVELLHKKYRVIRELGKGGMGSVWEVEHKELGQRRALKLIHGNYAADKQVRKRFRREAQILASLRHPNAVLVYDYDFIGQVPYIDMEYLKGETLRKRLKSGQPLPIPWIMWLVEELQKVLDLAHALKIVHRDLKPENIMIVEDPMSGHEQLKVLDFGIAKIVQQGTDENASLTMDTQGLLGTLAYASPEQNHLSPDQGPAKVDHRSDLYSVGVILFELFTGQRPFQGSPAQLLFQHAQVPPPTFKKVAPQLEIPAAIEAIVRRCLEKNPDDRPNSMAELLRDLRRAIQHADTSVPSAGGTVTEVAPGGHSNGRARRNDPMEVATSVVRETIEAPVVRWSRLAAGALVLAALTFLVFSAGLVKRWLLPPQATGIRRDVLDFLTYRDFQPVEDSKVLNGWPVSIRKASDQNRTWNLHDKLYLPTGFTPAPDSGFDDHGLPRTIQSAGGVQFVLLPGNTFKMGAFDDSFVFGEDEKPGHPQTLSTFYMQRTETTIGEFERFRRKQSRSEASFKTYDDLRGLLEGGGVKPEELGRMPAAGVPFLQAVRYARDLGGELPSEAQWEYAARSGGQPRLYVWGNREDGARQNVNLTTNAGIGLGVWEVGRAKDDQTDQGVRDLAGNVRELCRDSWSRYRSNGYGPDHVETPPKGEERPRFVIRGGSYNTLTEYSRTTFRKQMAGSVPYVAHADEPIDDVGFRVVIEVLVTDDIDSSADSVPTRKQERP